MVDDDATTMLAPVVRPEDAARLVGPGATMMVGGFGLVGKPLALVDALLGSPDARDLTVISNNLGEPGRGLGRVLRAGRIRKAIGSFFTSNPDAVAARARRGCRRLRPRVGGGALSRRGGGMTEAVVVAAVRSPIGRHGGALSAVRPDDLAAHVLRAVVERAGLEPSVVDDVYMGCANQAGEDNRDVARMASLLADFPETVPGVTLNRLCGSGLDAIAQAARAIMVGDADVTIGSGVESMSPAPWVGRA